ATEREAAADWRGAEDAYRELLERGLASDQAGTRHRAHAGLSGLYRLLGDHGAALEQARSAAAAARPTDLQTLWAMALEEQGACALRLGLLSEAEAAVDEALACLADDRMYDVQRGRCLIVRAECSLKSGLPDAAERDLHAAWGSLEAPS